MHTVRPAFFLGLLVPAAAEACGSHRSTTPTELSAMILLPLAALYYPFLFLGGCAQIYLGNEKSRSAPEAWLTGSTMLAYMLLYLLGSFLLDSLWLGQGRYGSPHSGTSGTVTLAVHGAWAILALGRTIWTLRSRSPRARSLRRLTLHPAWFVTMTFVPAVVLMAAAGPGTQGLLMGSAALLFLPALALIYHELLYSVHRTIVWLRSREGSRGASQLGDLDPGAAGCCPVCRNVIETAPQRCVECGTPHHADCHDFVGGCAIYGCGESASAAPD